MNTAIAVTKTIELLRKIIIDKNCERMNKSIVIGYLGELIVREQLEKTNIEVEHCGNQTGYDLVVGHDKTIKVDVKTSRLKDEYSWGCDHWGWALLHSNKKKPISATHFICVGFDNDLNPDRFILVPAVIAAKFPTGIRQFSKVINSMCVFPGLNRPTRKLLPKEAHYITTCERLLTDKSIKVIRQGSPFALDYFS